MEDSQAQTLLRSLSDPAEPLRLLAQNLRQLVWTARPDGRIEFANQSWIDFTGITVESGCDWLQAVAPGDQERCQRLWSAAGKDGSPLATVVRLCDQKGNRRRFDLSLESLRDREQRIVGWLGICTEIEEQSAEQKRANGRRRGPVGKSSGTGEHSSDLQQGDNRRYQELVEGLNAVVFECDPSSWRFRYISERAESLFGYPVERWLNEPDFWINEVLHPSDRDAVVATVRDNVSAGRDHEVEYRARRADGDVIWIRDVMRIETDDAGKSVTIRGLLINVTERKQAEQELRDSEQRFHTLADNISQLAWMADGNGWIFWFNKRWHDYTGMSLQDTEGWGWTKVHHPDHRERVVKRIQRSWDSGEPWEDTFPLRGRDGTFRWCLSRAMPIRNEQGEIGCWFGTNTDITEQREAEKALREGEQRLRLAISGSPVSVYENDQDLRYTWIVNPMPNFSSDQIVGKKDEDLLPAETVKPLIEMKRRVLRSGLGERQQFYLELNGQPKSFDVAAEPVRNSKGSVVGLRAAASDLTPIMQTERALRESQEKLRLAESAARVGSFQWNIQTNVNEWSPEIEALYGLEPGSFGGTYEAWRAAVHPDDVSRAEQRVQRALTSGEFEAEWRAIWPDGTVRWLAARGKVFKDQHGRPERMIGVNVDITDRKLAEVRLQEKEQFVRRVLDNLYAFVGVLTAEGKMIQCNLAPLEAASLEPEDVIGLDFWDCYWWNFSAETQDELRHNVARASRGELIRSDVVIRIRNDRKICVDFQLAPLHDSNGKVTHLIASGMDITARKQAEEALLEADRRKDEFLATLAHELRNPLAPIRSGLDVLKRETHDAALVNNVRDVLQRQTDQLVTLVDDLLEVSRITRGKLELRKSKVQAQEVIRSALEACRPIIEAAQHQLTVETIREPVYLDADPNRLTQVVSNLLNNAARYTPAGGKITLRTLREGNELCIEVIDNGVGIPAEMLDGIFEMFAQVSRSGGDGYSGLGIGLTLVKSLVEMHRGRVLVESGGEDMGSTFRVLLPTLEDSQQDMKQGPPEDSVAAAASGRRVLVVDDNAAAARMLGMVVEMLGSEVQLAANGQEACELAANFRPQVVLMDLGMPLMDGYEAACAIRQQPWGAEMTLIALSGWGQDEDKRKTKEAGFDHHLVKPADTDQLRQLLANAPEPK